MSENVYTENYKGYEIEIYCDEFAENPFESWDGNPPLAVLSFDCHRSNITEYSTQYGNVNNVPNLTRAAISRNLSAIIELCEVKNVWELTEDRRDHCYYGNLTCLINERITAAIDDLSDSERLEALASLYNMAGMPAIVKSIHGYSQGEYWEVLAVATPEFQKACGNAPDYWEDPKHLEASIELFKNWCIGNVYGYSVSKDDEIIDSCSGFYGDYDDNDYSALSEAKSSIDYRVEADRKTRMQQVKTWIKNRVPLIYRNLTI